MTPRLMLPESAMPARDAFLAAYAAWMAASTDRLRGAAALDAAVDLYAALGGWRLRDELLAPARQYLDLPEAALTPFKRRQGLTEMHRVIAPAAPAPASPPPPVVVVPETPAPRITVTERDEEPLTAEQQAQFDKLARGAAAIPALLGRAAAKPAQVLPPTVGRNPIVASAGADDALTDGDGARARAISEAPEEQPLEEELRPLATEMRALLSDAARTDRDVRYEVGVRVQLAQTDSRYGSGVVARLAGAVGVAPRTLQEAALVARRWSRQSYEQLAARATSRGEPITWRHLTTLASVDDDAQRDELLEELFSRGLSTRELETAVRAPKKAAKLPPNIVRALEKRVTSLAAELAHAAPGLARAGTAEERARLAGQLGVLGEAVSIAQDELRPPCLDEALGKAGLKLETETTKRDPS